MSSDKIKKKREADDSRRAGAQSGYGYVPLPLLGQIREKGFSSQSEAPRSVVSAPQPSVTAFPIARHRSEGPHWAPLPPSSALNVSQSPENPDDAIGENAAFVAQPLVRKKKETIDFSKWKVGRNKNIGDNISIPSEKEVVSGTQIKENILEAKIESLKGLQLGDYAQMDSIQSADGEAYSIEDRDKLKLHSAQSTEDIDGISEMSLGSMTAEQIIEAQQELKERFRPDILDMLRRRGKAKAEGQKNNSEMPIKKGSLPMPDIIKVNKKEDINGEVIGKTRIAKVQDDSGRDTSMSSGQANIVECVTPERNTATARTDSDLSFVDWKNMSWTDRVEAVRSFKFGLDWSFIGHGSTTVSTSLGGDKSILLNATERDFLRTEGDPSSDGYTVKEAIALVRSMVPAQRSAGLRIVSHILEKALIAFQSNSCERGIEVLASSVDWQAVWAYALGPEPELVLTLRLALDDSHATAIVTCARALECLLSSSANEQYFHLCECLWPGGDYLFTAPIFQKPAFQESGLIGDCYWKYNVKPSDMFNFSSNSKSEKEDDSSVNKDASIANQDVAAGLIRMGILPRIRYILEVDRLLAAEDSLFDILIALARHSPTAADAVMKCPRLMDTIMQLFVQDGTFTWPSRAKAIKLLKVLSIAKESNCIQIFNSGLFQAAQLGLSREGLNLGPAKRIYNVHQGPWIDLVEALNFWRVCVKYSLGIMCFSDLYPALLYWISTPNVVLSVEGTVDFEHGALTVSSFQLLDALANTLPVLHVASESELTEEANVDSWDTSSAELDVWSWKFAIPIVENSLDWLSSELIQTCIQSLQQQNGGTPMLFRILSSILHFLSTVCGRILEDRKCKPAWLPTFVPKLALQLVKSNLLDFSTNVSSELSRNTLVKCFLSRKEQLLGEELLHFTDCLHGLVRLLKVVDHLFISVKMDMTNPEPDYTSEAESLEIEGTLRGGLAVSAKRELMQLLKYVGDCLIKRTGMLNMLDTSRRGGPAPGIGIGWGCQGGGYWSIYVLTAQLDSVLLLELIELFPVQEIPSMISKELPPLNEDIDMFAIDSIWRIKVGLSAILLAGPNQRDLIENICHNLIFHNSALDIFRSNTKALIGKWLRKLEVDTIIQIDSYLSDLNLHIEEMRDILCQHVRNVWFQKKKKVSDKDITAEAKISKRTSVLPTVHEGNMSTSGRKDSLAVEWASQKLPLPSFWFLSPLLSNIQIENGDGIKNSTFKDENLNVVTVTSHGLVLLFGLETLSDGSLCVGLDVSIARKIHALSNVFILSDDIFLEKPVRSMIGALQELYMDFLPFISDQNLEIGEIDYLNVAERTIAKHSTFSLDFETLVDQRYTSFISRLTNQFAAVSYGDLVFGRQIAIYLTRNVPDSLRLMVWKSLETEHMLEFLPPIEQCAGKATVYLYPFEENQEIIKCYASAWSKGALDRAKIRNSVSFSLAQFHVASFIFKAEDDQNQLLRKTVAKDLLVALARRPHFQDSLQALFNYDEYHVIPVHAEKKDLRYAFLEEVCMDSPNLLAQIRLLKSLAALSHESVCISMECRTSFTKLKGMSTKDNNLLWEELFNDPSQFWDNRNSKITPNSPDFRHKQTRSSLWIHSLQNPSWVTQKLSRFPMKEVLNDRASSENVESSDRMTFLSSIKLCGTKKNLRKGRKLHAEIIEKKLFPGDGHVSTALLSMYAKCGAFEEAKEVFDQIQIRDVISWNALISGYAQNGHGDEVLKLVFQMGDYGIAPDGVTFVCVLKVCGTTRNLKMGEEIHSSITKQGLLENDIVLGTALVDMYAKCGALEEAQQVFHKLPIRNIVSWNALITGYTHYGMHDEALNSFYRMQDEGISPDVVTFVCILKGCSNTKSLEMGEEIHLKVNQQGLLANNLILGTALVDMYAKCGRLQKAQEVFDKLATRDVVLWSALIGGYMEHGLASEALMVFRKMRDEGIAPDAVTFVCVLKACASIKSLEMGEDIYAEVCKNGLLEKDIVLGNSLVDMYSKCGLLGKAQEVFDKLKVRNVVSWNALISGYTQHGLNDEALSCFRQMRDEGISPNVVTFTCILKVCSAIRSLDIGQMIHEEVRKQMLLENDIMVGIALVDMYAKCGELEKAQNVFDAIPLRDVVIWDALISGYAQQGLVDEALCHLKKMQADGFTPDVITFNSALKACGTTGFLNIGEDITYQIRRLRLLGKDILLGTTLVSMYAKCGELGKAHEAFNELQVQDVVAWSSLMACYAQLGQANRCLILFNCMIREGIVPDPVSFLVLLTACCHAGIVEEGEKVFDDMNGIYNLVPNLEHYACMVDMFSRAGQFSKALAMLEKVPASDHLPLLSAFLGACHKGVNAELGRWAFERSLLLDGKSRAAYICMGNIYAISGMYACASV